jgi:hypothetical protein
VQQMKQLPWICSEPPKSPLRAFEPADEINCVTRDTSLPND